MTGQYDDRDSDGTPPAWAPAEHLPDDARRIGLNRSVPDGALLDFAGNLDPGKRLHRITAWVMLAQPRATWSRPRHISSVVPSPQTT